MSDYSPFMQALLDLIDPEAEDRLQPTVSERIDRELVALAEREMSVSSAVAEVYDLIAELYRNDLDKTADAIDAFVTSHPAVTAEIAQTAISEQGLRLETAQRQLSQRLAWEELAPEPDLEKETVSAWQLLKAVERRV